MRKIVLCFALMFVLALAGSAFAAASVTVQNTANQDMTTIVMLDDEGNSELDRRKLEEDVNLERTIRIKNNGDKNLTNVDVSVQNVNSRYAVNTTYGSSSGKLFTIPTLNVGQSVSVDLTGMIPGAPRDSSSYPDSGSGQNNIGYLSLESDQTTEEQFSVVFVNEPLLEFYKDRVTVTVEDDDENMEDGETFEGVKPGDHVTVEVILENLIDEDVRNDKIKDINVEIIADSMDDGDEYEDDDEISKISGEDTDSVTFEFDVPEDIAADDYEVIITDIRGVDEFENGHEIDSLRFYLEIERERNKVEVKTTRLTTERIECGQRSTGLYVKIVNTGERDQDEAAIRIYQPKLNIDIWDRNVEELITIEDDEDDAEYAKSYTLNIPDNVKPGTYFITINSYFDEDILSDTTDVGLEILPCEEAEPEPTVPEEDEIVPEPVEPTTPEPEEEEEEQEPPITGGATEDVVEQKTSPLYTTLLVLANIGLIVVIVGLGIRLFKRD